MEPIYLDYNATTPIDPEVADAMRPCLDGLFGNPSSSHLHGLAARKAVETARCQVAELLNCDADEIIFTSGGTESNNFAIKGIAGANRHRGNHIITSAIEHPAVTEVCAHLAARGFTAHFVPVDETGLVDPDTIERAVTTQTVLITVMHANNEVGTIEPIEEIAAVARRHGVTFHTDAAQSVGKIPVNVQTLGVDLLSLAGHKLYAPKGVGALFVRRGTDIEKFMHGAGHERNMRAGTENVLEIVGLGKACEIAGKDVTANMARTKSLRDRLHEGLKEREKDLRLNGHPEKRLPNTLSIGFRNSEASALLNDLTIAGISASAGSACHAGETTLSPVLAAMKVPLDYAAGTLRLSVGRMTTEGEIDEVLSRMAELL